MEYKCVQCGFPIKTLFIQYSPGNIRLMKCENCKVVADEYIECEFMIVLIDLILQKPKAYRHVLYNVLNQKAVHFEGLLWKSIVGFLLLDGCIHLFNLLFLLNFCRLLFCLLHYVYPTCALAFTGTSFILNKNEKRGASFMGFSSLVWICQKVLMDAFVGNLMFLSVFLLATRIFLNMSIGVSRCKDILIAVLVSSYFKIFLVAMMVWEFPSSVIFIIESFVLSSNIVALKVISESDLDRCICTCFCAHVAKLLVTKLPNLGTL